MRKYAWLVAIFLMGVVSTVMAEKDYAAARAEMVADVAAMARESGPYTGHPVLSDAVMQAMATVPRHRFVPPEHQDIAYLNRAQPIGYEQTISQPYIVALMTHLARLETGDKVLEIGTGSGYQAAILAEIGAEVYSIEIVTELGRRAAETLSELGYDDLHLRIGNGYEGWPEAAPFDAIIVTAAPPHVPQTLKDQLAVDGNMVIPVGSVTGRQTLQVITKEDNGSTTAREVVPVGFVPMVKDAD